MLKYILKRLGLSIIILLGVSLIIYVLVRCMPFDFVEQQVAKLGQDKGASQEIMEQLYRRYKLSPDPTFWDMLSATASSRAAMSSKRSPITWASPLPSPSSPSSSNI